MPPAPGSHPPFPIRPTRPGCVALYGDSFTWSSDVEAQDAWGNVLSTLLDCRVSNFGVGGYGTDQAYLRFRENDGEGSPVVVIAHQPENILRNVNQYRPLLYPVTLRFKPRFRLDPDGRLELVDAPLIPVERYAAFVRRPEDFLEDEYFLPGGPSGVRHARFPFTWTLIRAAAHFHIVSELAGTPWYADFYEPDHPVAGASGHRGHLGTVRRAGDTAGADVSAGDSAQQHRLEIPAV